MNAYEFTLIMNLNGYYVQLRLDQKKRFDYILERNTINLFKFVNNHIEAESYMIHDGWSGYSFLDNDDSAWTDEMHLKGGGDILV